MDISVSLKFYGYGYAEFSWILPMESPRRNANGAYSERIE
jgi:hypothetical protein